MLSQYVSECVHTGRGKKELFSAGFNYERWRKTYIKAKQVNAHTPSLHTPSTPSTLPPPPHSLNTPSPSTLPQHSLPLHTPSTLFSPSTQSHGSTPPSKEAITNGLVVFLDGEIVRWCSQVDLVELCVNNHKQMLELKVALALALALALP